MTNQLKRWLTALEIEKIDLNIIVISHAIESTVDYIKTKKLYGKKHSATDAVSVLVGSDEKVEVHIEINNFKTYEIFNS